MQRPALAAGLAVTVAVLLAARSPLHRFVRSTLTEDELKDALIFAGATLVVLPLVPDRPMGPYGALNPHSIWILVILVMAISAAGYVAVRMLGRPVRTPYRRSCIRLHLKHRDYRRNGCAGCKDDGCSCGCGCGRGIVNDCDDRSDGTCSRRHEHDNPSNPVDPTDLRRLGRRRLWSCLYGPGSTAEDRKRSAKWPSLQPVDGFDIRLDPFWRPRRFRGASGMVW